ncbi:MAG: hypothetical protein WAM97_10035 [Acidimicrobiales bacterium]
MFDLQGCSDPQHPVVATGSGVDVGDEIGQKQMSDLFIARLVELDVVVGRSRDPDYPTADAF